MGNTSQLGLPLVAGAQAQKHVTVNEALAMLDGLSQLRIEGAPVAPPAGAPHGMVYRVPAGATGVWAGETGQLAIASNGGWVFVTPKTGWSAQDATSGETLVFDGVAWQAVGRNPSAGGATTASRVIEIDHIVSAGATSQTAAVLPANSIVLGVTGRVEVALAGPGLTGWALGVNGSANRYGSGLGIGVNSYALGLTGTPQTYYSNGPLLLTAEGGTFSSGQVRLAVHCLTLEPPRSF